MQTDDVPVQPPAEHVDRAGDTPSGVKLSIGWIGGVARSGYAIERHTGDRIELRDGERRGEVPPRVVNSRLMLTLRSIRPIVSTTR